MIRNALVLFFLSSGMFSMSGEAGTDIQCSATQQSLCSAQYKLCLHCANSGCHQQCAEYKEQCEEAGCNWNN